MGCELVYYLIVPSYLRYRTINFDLRYSLILNTCRNLVSGLGSYRYSQNTCRIRRPKVNFLLVLGPYSSREQSLILDSYILLSNLYRYGKDYLVSGRGNSSLKVLRIKGCNNLFLSYHLNRLLALCLLVAD